jgi:colanic acid/amylovoran biosynthesis protein
MKKVFVDIYLQFNLGDDLFLDILAKKFPNSQFTINYLGANYDDFISKYPNVKRRKYTLINKIGQRLKLTDSITNYDQVAETHDALLFIGGSIFREEYYHQTLYQDRMKMVNAFKVKKKSVFVLGANFGPFQSQKFYEDYKIFFNLCDDVCFRDTYSYNLYRNVNSVRYAPDIVFQLDTSEYKDIKSTNTIGFSIIDVRHKPGLAKYYNDYVSSTVKTIEKLIKEGNDCCLMSFCKVEGDTSVVYDIKNQLSGKAKMHSSIYEYEGEIKKVISEMASMKLIIASRFHANIIGILLGIGILPIIYSEKTTNVLTDLDIDKILIRLEEINQQYQNELLLKKSYSNFPSDFEKIKRESVKQFDKLEQLLEVRKGIAQY